MNSTIDSLSDVGARPPRSATPFTVGLAGIAAALAVLWFSRDGSLLSGAGRGFAACFAIIVVVASYELFVARAYLRPSAGLAAEAVRPMSFARVAMRLAGTASRGAAARSASINARRSTGGTAAACAARPSPRAASQGSSGASQARSTSRWER